MRIKEGFMLNSVGDEFVVVPIGNRAKTFHGMIRLNKSGAFLWEKMENEFTTDSLVKALLDKYDVSEETATDTVNKFVKSLLDGGIVEK